jgi:hypothetical protein
MKNLLLTAIAFFTISTTQAQSLNDLINQGRKIVNGASGNTGNNGNGGNKGLLGNNLSNTEIVNGLKEALSVGTKNASGKLNKTNGFFGNQLIKVLMPPELKNVESTLRSFGFNKQCDNLILSLNRAAEDASGKAVPIFVNAITSMNINDGIAILRGNNNAATDFLRRTTTAALTQAFRPVIDNSLGKVGATRYWKDIFTIYNRLPITKNKVNPDLTGYVTDRALNGMFVTVAQEELNIRQNPAGRVTDLLRKVFGG